MLKEQKGSKPATIVAETEPKVKQGTVNSPSPFRGKKVVKRSRVNGFIGWIYKNSVTNQREREGNLESFTPEPRKWGERIQGTPLVHYNGKTYLELKVENVLDTVYFVDGVETSVEDLKDYLPKPRQAKTQQTEKPIILADYNLDNIRSIKLDRALVEVE